MHVMHASTCQMSSDLSGLFFGLPINPSDVPFSLSLSHSALFLEAVEGWGDDLGPPGLVWSATTGYAYNTAGSECAVWWHCGCHVFSGFRLVSVEEKH
jgi:hypothetical protein